MTANIDSDVTLQQVPPPPPPHTHTNTSTHNYRSPFNTSARAGAEKLVLAELCTMWLVMFWSAGLFGIRGGDLGLLILQHKPKEQRTRKITSCMLTIQLTPELFISVIDTPNTRLLNPSNAEATFVQ